jgi:MerR family transcriptional regulator, aldehyde-responsive regulator
MNIRDAAVRSGLCIDTIRYYEKSGMLPKLGRDNRGWRIFSADNLGWLQILERLRTTGMPLKAVQRFAVLVHAKPDDASAAHERLLLLENHKLTLKRKREELEACQAYLDRKIDFYRKQDKRR